METQNETFTDESGATIQDKVLPNWAKWYIRSFAVFSFVVGISSLVYLFLAGGELADRMHDLLDGILSRSVWSLLFVATASALLGLYYSYNLLRLRSWTTVVAVVMAIEVILIWLVRLFVVSGTVSVAILMEVLIVVTAVVLFVYRDRLWGPKRKLLLQIPLILLMVPSIFLLSATLVFTDAKSIDDVAVLPPKIAVLSDDDNAYVQMISVAEMTDTEKDILSNDMDEVHDAYTNKDGLMPSDHAKLAAVVEGTQRITDTFLMAAQLPGWQCPGDVNNYSPNALICELNQVRDTALLVHLRVIHDLQTGEYADAVRAAGAIVAFADNFEQYASHSTLHYLVATAIRNIGYDALDSVLSELNKVEGLVSSSTTEVSQYYTGIDNLLSDTTPNREELVNTVKGEYAFMKSTTEMISEGIPPNYLWQPNNSLQKFAERTQLQIEYYQAPCGSTEEQEKGIEIQMAEEEYVRDGELPFVILKPGSINRILMSVVVVSLSDAKSAQCRLEVEHQQLQQRVASSSASEQVQVSVDESPVGLSVHNIEPGQTIGNLTVASVEIHPYEYFDGTKDFTVKFTGSTVLTGELYGPVMACDVGISLNEDSREALPQFDGYSELHSVCFDNPAEVTRAFGAEKIEHEDRVTITVADFVYVYAHKGSVSTASFVSEVQ